MERGTVIINGKTLCIKSYQKPNASAGDHLNPPDSSNVVDRDSDEKKPQVPKTADDDLDELTIEADIFTEIAVSNIPPDMKRDTFLIFFENKRNGGGDIEYTDFSEGDSFAVIRFKEPAGNV